MKKKTNYD